jgi:hypothetical protein
MDDGRVINEETALLSTVERRRKPKPLPWLQISIILLLQVCEPITGLSIYPYINQVGPFVVGTWAVNETLRFSLLVN